MEYWQNIYEWRGERFTGVRFFTRYDAETYLNLNAKLLYRIHVRLK